MSVAEALSCGKAAPLQPYPSLSISRGGGGEGRPTQATLLLLPDGARMDREGRDCPVDPAYPPLAVQRGLRPRQLIAETANARHPPFPFCPFARAVPLGGGVKTWMRKCALTSGLCAEVVEVRMGVVEGGLCGIRRHPRLYGAGWLRGGSGEQRGLGATRWWTVSAGRARGDRCWVAVVGWPLLGTVLTPSWVVSAAGWNALSPAWNHGEEAVAWGVGGGRKESGCGVLCLAPWGRGLSCRPGGMGGGPGCLAPGRVGVLSAPCGAGGDSADPHVGWFMTGARSCCRRRGSP